MNPINHIGEIRKLHSKKSSDKHGLDSHKHNNHHKQMNLEPPAETAPPTMIPNSPSTPTSPGIPTSPNTYPFSDETINEADVPLSNYYLVSETIYEETVSNKKRGITIHRRNKNLRHGIKFLI